MCQIWRMCVYRCESWNFMTSSATVPPAHCSYLCATFALLMYSLFSTLPLILFLFFLPPLLAPDLSAYLSYPQAFLMRRGLACLRGKGVTRALSRTLRDGSTYADAVPADIGMHADLHTSMQIKAGDLTNPATATHTLWPRNPISIMQNISWLMVELIMQLPSACPQLPSGYLLLKLPIPNVFLAYQWRIIYSWTVGLAYIRLFTTPPPIIVW